MIDTIVFQENNTIKIIDQTKLPARLVYKICRRYEDLGEAIKRLEIRGAPAIGIAAAYGLVLGMLKYNAENFIEFKKKFRDIGNYFINLRPTAVNIRWAVERMTNYFNTIQGEDIKNIKLKLKEEAIKIFNEDLEMCRKIGENGEKLIPYKCNILTHCNAGGLATSGLGTALAVIYEAHRKGKKIKVYIDETRPLLQGSRLTAWELQKNGVDIALICDNMSAMLMKKKMIDLIIVGADRIAKNGDTANKIGTYNLAVLAYHHKVPFYVAAPSSSFDMSISDGDKIPIEYRDAKEVTNGFGRRTAPENVAVINPAFDVTPARYITAYITEKSVIKKISPHNFFKKDI